MTAQKNTLFTLIDKAPFAGKFAVKESYLDFLEAPDDKKTKQLIGTSAFLGFMVAVHAYQAKLGYDALSVHAPMLSEDIGTKEAVMTTIDTVYTGAMAAVALRQTSLTARVAEKYLAWRKNKTAGVTEPPFNRRDDYPSEQHYGRAVKTAVAVTLAGQLLGLASMTDAKLEQLDFYDSPQYISQEPTHYVSPVDDNTIVIAP